MINHWLIGHFYPRAWQTYYTLFTVLYPYTRRHPVIASNGVSVKSNLSDLDLARSRNGLSNNEILPSDIRIKISKYRDPYKPIDISWNVTRF